jgi:hypothetical protein
MHARYGLQAPSGQRCGVTVGARDQAVSGLSAVDCRGYFFHAEIEIRRRELLASDGTVSTGTSTSTS